MDEKWLDELLQQLESAHNRKKERLLIKANAEIEAIQREDVAYYDGVYDAIKEVKNRLKKDGERKGGVNDAAD